MDFSQEGAATCERCLDLRRLPRLHRSPRCRHKVLAQAVSLSPPAEARSRPGLEPAVATTACECAFTGATRPPTPVSDTTTMAISTGTAASILTSGTTGGMTGRTALIRTG